MQHERRYRDRTAEPTLAPANVIPHASMGTSFARIRRSLAAYTRDRPDPLTAAFIETLGRNAALLPTHARSLLNLGTAQV